MAAWDLWESMRGYGNIAAPSNIMCGRLLTLFAGLYAVTQHLADFFAIQQMAVGVAEFAPDDGSGFVK